MSDHIDRHLVLGALSMAVGLRRPPPGLLHHTDRGSHYTAGDHQDALKAEGIVASMSRKGNCWDNAAAESFFSTLKTELPCRFDRGRAGRLLRRAWGASRSFLSLQGSS